MSITAELQGDDIYVTWSCTDSSGVAACVLDARQPDGAWTNLSNESSGTYDYVPDTPGHLYTFRVTAADSVGNEASAEDGAGLPRTTKYYYHGGKRVAMRVDEPGGAAVYYLHGDHLGSTSLTTDGDGAVVARQLYHPYGEVRWRDGALPTDFTFTGQRNEAGIGLMDYHARFYDPALARFISADSLIPSPSSPQSLNRYSYVLNSPLVYRDPSGHAVCLDEECAVVLHPVTGRLMTGYMPGGPGDKAQIILQYLGGVNDLEALAQISDMTAHYYPDWNDFLPEMSETFLGAKTYGPATLLLAVLAGGCGGIGREPRDCEGNEHYFLSMGFHKDFQDVHNQPYHAWGFVAQTAAPGSAPQYMVGRSLGMISNWGHEWVQSELNVENGWGTSWQDYTLSESAMAVGLLISAEAVTPAQLGDLMRYAFGPQGPGSDGNLQRLEKRWGPLRGSP